MISKGVLAILVEKFYQDLEVWYPYLRFREEGYETIFVGMGDKSYTGKNGYPLTVDRQITDVKASELAALIIPGGWAPDFLRQRSEVLNLVREMDKRQKPIGAICHAGWVLASAGIVMGRKVTSFKAIRDDMVHAGAEWVDAEVVVDKNLVTSRTPLDLPAFCRELNKLLT